MMPVVVVVGAMVMLMMPPQPSKVVLMVLYTGAAKLTLSLVEHVKVQLFWA